jgi:hypothetical protein
MRAARHHLRDPGPLARDALQVSQGTPGGTRRLDAPIAVSLEAIVPTDRFYRHLERAHELRFVRDWTRERYADCGRPSIDPVALLSCSSSCFSRVPAPSAS